MGSLLSVCSLFGGELSASRGCSLSSGDSLPIGCILADSSFLRLEIGVSTIEALLFSPDGLRSGFSATPLSFAEKAFSRAKLVEDSFSLVNE